MHLWGAARVSILLWLPIQVTGEHLPVSPPAWFPLKATLKSPFHFGIGCHKILSQHISFFFLSLSLLKGAFSLWTHFFFFFGMHLKMHLNIHRWTSVKILHIVYMHIYQCNGCLIWRFHAQIFWFNNKKLKKNLYPAVHTLISWHKDTS